MARLITPDAAVQFKKKNGKFHLLNPRSNKAPGWMMTVCNFLVWEDEKPEIKPVSKLKASDICQKCLGPLIAKD